MKIGVPKEVKTHEYRVGLTPTSVRELTAHGHEVVVETNAGAGIGAHRLFWLKEVYFRTAVDGFFGWRGGGIAAHG